MADLIRHLDSGSEAGMTFNTIVMADLIRHLESRFRLGGRNDEGGEGRNDVRPAI